MRDILVKILDAIIALQPEEDEETPAVEGSVSDSRELEEPEEISAKSTKRSVKK